MRGRILCGGAVAFAMILAGCGSDGGGSSGSSDEIIIAHADNP